MGKQGLLIIQSYLSSNQV